MTDQLSDISLILSKFKGKGFVFSFLPLFFPCFLVGFVWVFCSFVRLSIRLLLLSTIAVQPRLPPSTTIQVLMCRPAHRPQPSPLLVVIWDIGWVSSKPDLLSHVDPAAKRTYPPSLAARQPILDMLTMGQRVNPTRDSISSNHLSSTGAAALCGCFSILVFPMFSCN
jgi:hypothetical protein